MIIDKEIEFSDGQTITVAAPSTDSLDRVKPADIYHPDAYLVVQVDEDFAGAGLTGLTVAMETDAASNYGTKDTLFTQTVPVASLKAGKSVVKARMPMWLKRYTRLYYTPVGANATGGKVSAFVTPGIDKSYE